MVEPGESLADVVSSALPGSVIRIAAGRYDDPILVGGPLDLGVARILS